MFALSSTAFFEKKMAHKHHTQRIRNVKPSIDTSKPKSKLKCTKQPLSQFNRLLSMQLQNKHLLNKLTNPSSNLESRLVNHRIIKNNRKKYYQQYQRHLENQGLLKRIKSAKTSYSKKRHLNERNENEQYIQMLCKFGYKNTKNQNYKYNLLMLENNQTQQIQQISPRSHTNQTVRQRKNQKQKTQPEMIGFQDVTNKPQRKASKFKHSMIRDKVFRNSNDDIALNSIPRKSTGFLKKIKHC